MKRALRIIVPLILAIAVVGCMAWYLLVYDRDFTKDLLLSQARNFESAGNHKASAWLYDIAYHHSSQEPNVAIELARQHKAAGNYTKAEYTLSKAIAQSSDPSLYAELCATYVEQDKLLDAVTMLDSITDPAIKEHLDSIRPQAPVLTPEPGFYSQYISVTVQSSASALYISTNRKYPSTALPYSDPVVLPGGETTIYALAVSDDGLVSPLTVGGYTVGGVIEQVCFADSAIESAIRTILGVDEGAILYTNDLWSITQFSVPAEAATYEDISFLTGLRSLTIDNGLDGDLSCLSKLTCLEELTISGCRLDEAELTAIGKMVSLQKLTLSGCSLTNIGPLEKLSNLVYLDLGNNAIRNISILSGMTALQELRLRSNALTDISSLSGLSNLYLLDVSYNSLSSLSPVSGISGLKTLDASHNQLTSADSISSMTGLSSLNLSNNALIDCQALTACISLTELDVSNNTLSDIDVLSALTNLITLNFSYNQVSALPAFDKECTLVTIDGTHNQISSLEPLSGLPKLNNVLMDYNEKLSSLKPLDSCPLLVLVNAYGTKVKEVSFLTEKGVIVNFDPTA